MNDKDIINKLTNVIEELTTIIKEINSRDHKLPQEVAFDTINDPFNSKQKPEIIEKIVEVIKEVPVEKIVEKIVEVPVEVIKEVEVPVEVIKEVYIERESEEKITTSKETKLPEKTVKHNFPEFLYHESGLVLEKYTGELIYKPNYVLKHNQLAYGVKDEWNVIVTFKDGVYKTEHPQPHFNNQILQAKKVV